MKLHLLDEQQVCGIRGDFERGWEIAQKLAQTSPDCPRAKFNRGWYELMQGRLHLGLELLEYGRYVHAYGDGPLSTRSPILNLADHNPRGKQILLKLEGGFGDSIINLRFAKKFADMGANVIVAASDSLCPVIARMEEVAGVVRPGGAEHVYHDYWVPGFSAPYILGYEYPDLSGKPYLEPLPEYVDKWSHLKGKIGLKFFGNPKFEAQQHRVFPRKLLLDAVEGRDVVSLQLEDGELTVDSWEDTLGILANLDLVISSCSSVVHAAGAMGKEVWAAVPILPYYTWALPGDRTPWYDSVRLFRQTTHKQWDNVFNLIKEALDARYSS